MRTEKEQTTIIYLGMFGRIQKHASRILTPFILKFYVLSQ